MVRVRCLAALRRVIEGRHEVSIPGVGTVEEALAALHRRYGDAFAKRVLDDSGRLRRYIAIHVNGKDIRLLQGLSTKVDEDDEISLMPIVAGG
ncbi:TPA: MoaD family protein [Candidatus Bathyarchaeota archaeon]|nr:MoaD family protein [Candidatus Bathyarchaeota archaeon]